MPPLAAASDRLGADGRSADNGTNPEVTPVTIIIAVAGVTQVTKACLAWSPKAGPLRIPQPVLGYKGEGVLVVCHSLIHHTLPQSFRNRVGFTPTLHFPATTALNNVHQPLAVWLPRALTGTSIAQSFPATKLSYPSSYNV